jgi:hypothetical protein
MGEWILWTFGVDVALLVLLIEEWLEVRRDV